MKLMKKTVETTILAAILPISIFTVPQKLFAQGVVSVDRKDFIYSDHTSFSPPPSVTVYRLDDGGAMKRSPAIVFFHGGGWVKGRASQFHRQAELLARRGVVTASVAYPLGDPKVATESAQTALCWFRQHAKEFSVDTARIAVAGASAGGQLALSSVLTDPKSNPACAGVDTPLGNALLLFNPVLDLNGKWEQKFGSVLGSISPMNILSAPLPPTIILQGDADTVTPLSVAEEFVVKAHELGSPDVEIKIYEGRGHGFFNREDFEKTSADMMQFLSNIGWIE